MPSTVIRRYEYDEAGERLIIEFVTGRRYAYARVPPELYEAMTRVTSKGAFFNRKIRDNYPFERLRS